MPDEPKCRKPGCTAKCWQSGRNPDEPCWGDLHVLETHPDIWVHYCEGHGDPDDTRPYQRKPGTP